jgi:hypothetical protein
MFSSRHNSPSGLWTKPGRGQGCPPPLARVSLRRRLLSCFHWNLCRLARCFRRLGNGDV